MWLGVLILMVVINILIIFVVDIIQRIEDMILSNMHTPSYLLMQPLAPWNKYGLYQPLRPRACTTVHIAMSHGMIGSL